MRKPSKSHIKKTLIIILFIFPTIINSSITPFNLKQLLGLKPIKGGIMGRYYFPKATSVYLAGDFNNWNKNIKLEKINKHGVFEIFLPLLLDKKDYHYKIIIDGIWQKDPNNPNFLYDKAGEYMSILQIPSKMITYNKNPKKIGEDEYKFNYKNVSAETVYLVGDFNNYNPYENKMRRDKNGIWVTKTQIFPGTHYYCFVVDGEWIIDPEKINTAYNRFNKKFTIIKIQ